MTHSAIIRQSAVGLVAVMVVLLVSGRSLATPVTWSGNGHSYEAVLKPNGIQWTTARDSAIARGGHLATITSPAENDFVYSLVSDDSYWYINQYNSGIGPWLGAYQPAGSPEPDGGWTWLTGEPWNYTNWAPGEPNNLGGIENYLEFFGYLKLKDQTWNDLSNDGSVRGYIVEYVPEPGALLLLAIGGLGLVLATMRKRKPSTTG